MFVDENHYHNARRNSDSPPTVSIRHDISVANAQKSYCYKPHGIKDVGMFHVVVSTLVTKFS